MGRGNFWGKGAHCKVYGHRCVCCAKTAEPIDLPFGLWTWMGPDGGPEMLRDVAMATNFGTQFAITGFV